MRKDVKALVIYGPTATGKTALALTLAKKFNGESLSADSRQVYKSLDVGSGKVAFGNKVEKHNNYWIVDGIRIDGFDLVAPGEQFTAADFLKHANRSIIRIIKEKKVPIIVGGTGFYIKALINGLGSIGIPANEKLRSQLENLSIKKLYQKLQSINPKRAQSMNQSDHQNPRRLIRAIEIALSRKQSNPNNPKTQFREVKLILPTYLLIGLTASNDYLYKRSDAWLKERLDKGLIEEVESLVKSGVSTKWLDSLGLEYRWLTRYILGLASKEEAIGRLKGDTHNLIRRQKTWFKQFKGIDIFDIQTSHYEQKIKETFAQFIDSDIY